MKSDHVCGVDSVYVIDQRMYNEVVERAPRMEAPHRTAYWPW
jgi:hypothetical protein